MDREFIKFWKDNTNRIRAGNGGCVTPAMCKRELTKEKPFEHGFMMREAVKVRLRKNPAKEILKLIGKEVKR